MPSFPKPYRIPSAHAYEIHINTHAQKEYGKVLEMKSTPFLNILYFYFFKTSKAFIQSLA